MDLQEIYDVVQGAIQYRDIDIIQDEKHITIKSTDYSMKIHIKGLGIELFTKNIEYYPKNGYVELVNELNDDIVIARLDFNKLDDVEISSLEDVYAITEDIVED